MVGWRGPGGEWGPGDGGFGGQGFVQEQDLGVQEQVRRAGPRGARGPGVWGPGGVQEIPAVSRSRAPGVARSRAALTASLLPSHGPPQSEELGARLEPHVAALR